jgi:hypothetical protein
MVMKAYFFFLNMSTEQYSLIQFIDKQAKERWVNY